MGLEKALRDLKKAVTGGSISSSGALGPDGFPSDPASQHFTWHGRINDFLAEVPDFTAEYTIKPAAYPSGRCILDAPAAEQILAVEAMMLRRAWIHKEHSHSFSTSFGLLHKLTNQLFRRELPYTCDDAARLVKIVAAQMASTHWFDDDLIPILKICERLKAQAALSAELRQALQQLKAAMRPNSRWESAARERFRDTIDRLMALRPAEPLDAGEAWSNGALEDLKQMPAQTGDAWRTLFEHCLSATSSKPTQKWTRTAQTLIEAIGRDEFKPRIVRWFELVALPRPIHCPPRSRWQPDPDLLLTDKNSATLKGLAWCGAEWKDAEITRALSRLAQTCFKKVPNLGARCPRVGNACLYSLSVTSTDEAAAELTRLNQIVKQPSARKLIDKSLDTAAEKSGQTREDLEEATVPTYGLDAEGCLKQVLGDFTAEFRVTGPDAQQLLWRKADGKLQKSTPADVKAQHATELKKLKRTLQDIEKMLPAQRQRIERLLLSEREWEFKPWRDRYLDHPLLAHLARRLIWQFRQDNQQAAGVWRDGTIVDVQDRGLDWLSPKTRVRLWHPLGQNVKAVAQWRQWFETHQISQPFKQVHREIYILTDAERQTGTYSNRFAAHLIRQHQFAALTKERGWTYRLQGDFDSHNVPTLLLPGWDLAVEFWTEAPGGREQTSASGIYLYLSTDQVRFCNLTGEPRPLSEVPALIFSEIMRDVDLFVGVCSVGNDPAWHDRGEAGAQGGYWYRYAFGNLSASAQTRREVLERLVPRLKIAGVCSLQEKFLVVRGSLRTYKIHLGSANILMEPNDRYLCIVPDRSHVGPLSNQNVFLPFEGDNTLAIILSKAFLLADDAKIKDLSILNQIRH
ncbi:MAG TPA: DUF4132 domain-containing protein [Verrucomicrobiae bacterium]|nr:DUF4132 domain-containing protein [Verrucomicrobiae bacterium]